VRGKEEEENQVKKETSAEENDNVDYKLVS
jgi:hypothetical protein